MTLLIREFAMGGDQSFDTPQHRVQPRHEILIPSLNRLANHGHEIHDSKLLQFAEPLVEDAGFARRRIIPIETAPPFIHRGCTDGCKTENCHADGKDLLFSDHY